MDDGDAYEDRRRRSEGGLPLLPLGPRISRTAGTELRAQARAMNCGDSRGRPGAGPQAVPDIWASSGRRTLVEHVLSLGGHARHPRPVDDLMSPMRPPLPAPGDPCPAYDLSDERHSDHFVFLSELSTDPDMPPCECLAAYLNQPYPTHAHRTVVIDQECIINSPLIIPQGVTLRGCGMHGPGRLVANGDFQGAVLNMGTDQGGSFDAPSSIEDLELSGTNVPGVAINIYGHNKSVRRVRISGFNLPIRSHPNTRNVLLDGLVITGLVFSPIGVQARGSTWRIRNCFIRDTLQWGIDCEASDVVIESCRLENNGDPASVVANTRGAVNARGSDIRLVANYIENNGLRLDPVLDENNQPVLDQNGNPVLELVAIGTAVCITADARRVSVVANLFSGDAIAFDARIVANPGVPNATELFGPGSVALPELTPLLVEGRHSFAFNTDADPGENFYPHRGMAVAGISTFEVIDF
jgi:hypothetical protein